MTPCASPISAGVARAGSSSSSSSPRAVALAGVPPSGVTGPPATVLVVIGGALIVAGGVMAFLGVQALGPSFTPNPRPLEAGELVETGIYRIGPPPDLRRSRPRRARLGRAQRQHRLGRPVGAAAARPVPQVDPRGGLAHGSLSGLSRPTVTAPGGSSPDSSDGGTDARPDPCRLRSRVLRCRGRRSPGTSPRCRRCAMARRS